VIVRDLEIEVDVRKQRELLRAAGAWRPLRSLLRLDDADDDADADAAGGAAARRAWLARAWARVPPAAAAPLLAAFPEVRSDAVSHEDWRS